MYNALNPSQCRAFALTILIALVVLILLAVIYPIWSLNQHYDERISQQQNQIRVYQDISSQEKYYQTEHDRLKVKRQSDRRYLQSETDSLAKAELQRRVKQVISSRKGDILSTQIVGSDQEDGFNRVAIRVRMKSTLKDTVNIFHKLESEKPYLFVNEITIRSRPIARRRLSATKAIVKELERLDIDFQLVGYMKRVGT